MADPTEAELQAPQNTSSDAAVAAPAFDKDEVIKAAKDFLELCVRAEGNRDEALQDLRFLAGEQWPEKARRERELDGRPCLTINKLPTFLHQLTNDQRQNVPSIKVSPVGDTDVKKAEIVQGLVRHIEYSSNADVAYDTAVNSAAAIGFGYFRLVTEYCAADSFDQEIRFKRIRNPFTVYIDPLSEEPDGSDMQRAMITLKLPRESFRSEYPDADAGHGSFSVGVGDHSNQDWIGDAFVRIAEFYRIEHEADELVELSNGESGYRSTLLSMPPGVTIKRSRPTQRPKVMLYKLTAIDVLENTEIKCRWIPVFPVYGDELDIDGDVIRSGMVRNARDPAQMYNFWMTAATEEVALRPKTPYIGAEGTFEGYEDDWSQANVKSFPYLEYKPISLEGMLAPAPSRQPMADVPTGVLALAMHANDNIKATTGLFDSSLGARGNATSGIQERAQQRQGDVANFHYIDNLNRTVRHVGRCLVSMIPAYYDAARVVRIMGDDDKISSVPVNQPAPPDEFGTAVQQVLNDLTVGEYDVTVKAGPSYSTLRQEALASMMDVGGKWPKLMDVAGDKVIRAMDWPGAEEIAERVARTIPPEIRGDDDEGQQAAPVVQTPQGPVPLEQAGQMLGQLQQQIQQMGQALQEATSGIEKARIDADAKVKVAQINAEGRGDVAELQGMIQMLLKRIAPPQPLVAAVAEDLGEETPNNDFRPAPGPGAEVDAMGQPDAGQAAGTEQLQ